MAVTFRSGEATLEGDLTVLGDCTRGAVICHPHPQYGGDMDNPIVCAVAGALAAAGCATLRFNFRGVGRSGGAYGGGVGEAEDVEAATRYLIEESGVERITLAGYSFGAMMVLRVGVRLPAVDRLIAIAPPLSFFTLECVAACGKEKLFVVGDRDQYCPVAEFTRQLAMVADPKTHRILPGADHFLYGYEHSVADAVRSFALNGGRRTNNAPHGSRLPCEAARIAYQSARVRRTRSAVAFSRIRSGRWVPRIGTTPAG